MFKRIVLAAMILSSFFSPIFVFAQVADSGSTQCWLKDQCLSVRKDLIANAAEAEEGFYGAVSKDGKSNSDRAAEITRVCGGVKDANGRDVGFCLPASLTVTKISFGGRTEFAHIGDFIKYMYKYGIGVAGILGTVMIIFGGFQWATSGGNSATIGSAKKKITGSIIGMLLTVISYTILNTINPALVNLRVPGVFMINSMGLPPANCEDVKKGNMSNSPNGPFTIPPDSSKLICGQKYYVEGTGNLTCQGTKCGEKNYCSKYSFNETGSKDSKGWPIVDLKNEQVCLPKTRDNKVLTLTVKYYLGWGFNAIFANSFLGNFGTTLEAPVWFDRENNSDGIVRLCKKDDGTKYYSTTSLTQHSTMFHHGIQMVSGKMLEPYYGAVVNYVFNISSSTTCPDGGTVVSFYLKHDAKVKELIDTADALFFVSPAASGDLYELRAGPWSEIKGLPGFSVEELNRLVAQGKYLDTEVTLPDTKVAAIYDEYNVKPQ